MSADMAATCPVCRAMPYAVCLGVDYLPLPTVHGERVAETPLFDALMAGAR